MRMLISQIKLPKRIQIGAYIYKVRELPVVIPHVGDEEALGCIRTCTYTPIEGKLWPEGAQPWTIEIKRDQPFDIKRTTLLHEIVHGIIWDRAIDEVDEPTPEFLAQSLTNALIDVLDRNNLWTVFAPEGKK